MATIKQGLWYQCKKSHPYFTEGNYYYAPSDEINQAIKGATLSWATEKDEKEGTETPANGDDNGGEGGDNNGGNGGGGNNNPPGELEE